MSRSKCVRGILKNAEDLTDEEIDRVIGELERKRTQRRARGEGVNEAAQTSKEAEAIAADLQLAAAIERRNAKLNQVIYRAALEDVGRFGDDAAGLEALIAGTNKRVESGRRSVDALRNAYEGKYFGGLVHDLRKAGLLQYVQPRFMGFGKGLLDDKIATELWELREGGTPGSTGSPEAQGIAKIIHKYQELSRTDQNLHGAFIRKMEGYIVAQAHDMFRIARAGKDEWVRFIRPLLDEDRTFEGIGLTGDEAKDAARVDEFLGRVYDELSTGSFYKADTDAPLIGFKGPANLAKKVSQSRVLHFKGATEWTRYNDNFGAPSLMEAVASGLRHAAMSAALLERLGPNPRAMYERLLGDLRKKAVTGDKRVRDRLNSAMPMKLMDVADGTVDIPSSVTTAGFASGVRAIQTQASLGGAVLASLPDIATAASELQFQGRNFLGAMGDQLSSMLAQIGDAGQRREAAELVGVGVDSIIRDVASRMTSADNAGRLLNKANTAFFKLNLLEPWTNAGERAISSIMSRDLAMRKGAAWADLPDRLRGVLGQYGIDAKGWDTIRKSAISKVGDTEYIVPDALRDAVLDKRAAAKLETSLRAYFTDRSAVGVLQGGIREKAYTTQGAQAGTALGEAVRFAMQFKQYGISFVQKVLGRYGQEDRFWSIPGSLFKMPREEAAQFAKLIVTLTALGYVSMAAKDLAKGRTPRDPAKPQTMVAAMAQGGGFGIYSDFLFARANRFGGGLLETAAGPTVGDLSDLGDIFLKTRDYATGVSKDAPDVEAWNFFKGNTPFMNLFYTRAALDYLILYDMQEALSPGSLRRMERRLKEENGQEFLIPPSQVVD